MRQKSGEFGHLVRIFYLSLELSCFLFCIMFLRLKILRKVFSIKLSCRFIKILLFLLVCYRDNFTGWRRLARGIQFTLPCFQLWRIQSTFLRMASGMQCCRMRAWSINQFRCIGLSLIYSTFERLDLLLIWILRKIDFFGAT